jgi:peptidoglycan-associated lipoprotein
MGARRISSFLAILVLVTGLSACTKDKKDDGGVTGDGNMGGQPPVSGGYDPNGPVPGSQQDLVVNVGDRVFFGYDQYDLTSEARSTIERQAQWLKQYPSVGVMVEGHADERGTREYNIALGEKRASAVRNYLIANGVEPSRLQTISYGKERPAVMGAEETSWAQNRRGVLVVQ